jgi:antitoxin component YwqK of YwqJK toxin-antitoxin module
MRGLIICLFLLMSGSLIAQNTANQVDAQGRKQGFWTKKDTGGKLVYQATFKDDRPVGEMKRFHPNGKVMAILNYTEKPDEADAQLFDESGKLVGQGKYINQKKSGEWKYLSDGKMVSTETYLNGQKNGTFKRFYKTGELLEESNWQNDKLNGIYRTYFQDGKVFLECNYSEGLRNGAFKTWLPNGTIDLEGIYTNDTRDKDWKYFNAGGELRYTLKYELGKLLNPEVQERIDKENAGTFKSKGDNIPDPDKFMENPEEYMRLMQIH